MFIQEKIDAILPDCRRGKSYHGKKISVLKSGICKYYRRAKFDKFEWCVVEMFLFCLAKNEDNHSSVKAVETNLKNRLKILLMEEMVPNQIGRIYQGIMILEEFARDDLSFEERFILLKRYIELVKKSKRARIVSYINRWWRFHPLELHLPIIKLDKVLKFKKKGDSDDLLRMGEMFICIIEYIYCENNIIPIDDEEKDRIFGVFDKIYNYEGDVGKRYRRADPVYLVVEILEHAFSKHEKMMKIIEFAKEQLFRKQLVERRAFGLWLVVIVRYFKEASMSTSKAGKNFTMTNEEIEEYFTQRKDINIVESYVVEDYHVDRSHGTDKFRREGAKVIGEDLSLLPVCQGEKYRLFYASPEVEKEKFSIEKVDFIPFDEFEDVKVLEDGVCGGKVCCISVKWKGKPYILKEMRESFNHGKDYYFMDLMKKEFGIRDLGMRRITSDRYQERVDKSVRSMKGNWELVPPPEGKKVYYCMMNDFKNIGDIGKNKDKLEDWGVYKECIKIRLYDGLFMSSDNILRNILVNENGDLMSIDEGDIFGKRSIIFNKNDWCTNKKNLKKTRKAVREIIEEWGNGEGISEKCKRAEEILKKLKFPSHLLEKMKERANNYVDIVLEELEE